MIYDMVLSALLDNLSVQSPLILVAFLSAFFLRYLLFFSLIPIGCSRLTLTLLSLSLALTALFTLLIEPSVIEASLRFKSWPKLGLWIQQGLLGLELALPYLVVSCALNLFSALLEGLVGGGFMSLFSPWFKIHSSSLRTMMDSWAICVVLLPGNFQMLAGELFRGVSQAQAEGGAGIATWIGDGSGLLIGAEALLAKLTQLVSIICPLLMLYLFLDLAAIMVSKVLSKGMFQGELSQLKGVLTLLIFSHLSLDPEKVLNYLGLY